MVSPGCLLNLRYSVSVVFLKLVFGVKLGDLGLQESGDKNSSTGASSG